MVDLYADDLAVIAYLLKECIAKLYTLEGWHGGQKSEGQDEEDEAHDRWSGA